MFQFPSSRPRIGALPLSAPTPGVAPLPQQGNVPDLSGYDPGLHPDQLPPPVPGHGSIFYELTRQQKAGKQSSKPAEAPKSKKPTVRKSTAKKPDPIPTVQNPKKPKSHPHTARQDTQTDFGVELVKFDGVTNGVVASLDYVLLRDQAWLNSTLVDFASFEIFAGAEAEVSASSHIFPTRLYQRLSGIDIRRRGRRRRPACRW